MDFGKFKYSEAKKARGKAQTETDPGQK